MDQITTYTIKSKQNGFVWLFKYQLNGNFIGFEILDCQLSETQKKWLKNNFPFVEDDIKEWQKSLKDNFEIIKAEPILNFENLWNLYGNKVSKWDAEKAFNKLSDSDKIKCFLANNICI